MDFHDKRSQSELNIKFRYWICKNRYSLTFQLFFFLFNLANNWSDIFSSLFVRVAFIFIATCIISRRTSRKTNLLAIKLISRIIYFVIGAFISLFSKVALWTANIFLFL